MLFMVFMLKFPWKFHGIHNVNVQVSIQMLFIVFMPKFQEIFS